MNKSAFRQRWLPYLLLLTFAVGTPALAQAEYQYTHDNDQRRWQYQWDHRRDHDRREQWRDNYRGEHRGNYRGNYHGPRWGHWQQRPYYRWHDQRRDHRDYRDYRDHRDHRDHRDQRRDDRHYR